VKSQKFSWRRPIPIPSCPFLLKVRPSLCPADVWVFTCNCGDGSSALGVFVLLLLVPHRNGPLIWVAKIWNSRAARPGLLSVLLELGWGAVPIGAFKEAPPQCRLDGSVAVGKILAGRCSDLGCMGVQRGWGEFLPRRSNLSIACGAWCRIFAELFLIKNKSHPFGKCSKRPDANREQKDNVYPSPTHSLILTRCLWLPRLLHCSSWFCMEISNFR